MAEEPTPDVSQRHEQREDLARIAQEQEAAVWGTEQSPTRRGVGLEALASDVGPKGVIAAQLRGVTRDQRRAEREVPYGTALPGTGRYIFAFVVLVAAAALGLVALLGWLTS